MTASERKRPTSATLSAATDSVVYCAASSWISGLSRIPATPVIAEAMIQVDRAEPRGVDADALGERRTVDDGASGQPEV